MINEQQISKTVKHFYEAALNPDMWQTALQTLSDTLDCYGANLYFWDFEKNIIDKVYETTFPDENIMRDYVQHYHSLDPRSHYCKNNPDSLTYFDNDIMSNDEKLHSEYLNWERTETEQTYAYGTMLSKIGDYTAALSLGRNNNAGHPSEEENFVFHKLIPHMKRAVELGQIIELQKIEGDALRFAADQNKHAVMLLDQTGDLLHLNDRARKILARNDVFMLVGRRISVLNSKYQQRFTSLINNILQAEPLNDSAGGRMAIPTMTNMAPYRILISPMPKCGALWAVRRPTVMVVLSDPANNRLSAEYLSRIHGFSRREAELAVLLMGGEDLAAATKNMGISTHTVRAYLKNMFLKTQTHSLTAMVALLMKC